MTDSPTSDQPTRLRNPWGDAKGCLLWFGILGAVALVVLIFLGSQMKQEEDSLDAASPMPSDELISTLLKISGRASLAEGSDYLTIVERSTRDCTLDNGLPGIVTEMHAEVPLDEIPDVEAGLDRVEEYWRGSDAPVEVESISRGDELTGAAEGFRISVTISGEELLLEGSSACTAR